jgi:hypothetical protein
MGLVDMFDAAGAATAALALKMARNKLGYTPIRK